MAARQAIARIKTPRNEAVRCGAFKDELSLFFQAFIEELILLPQ